MIRPNADAGRNSRGFTLLEAMVTLAAFGLIMVVAFQLFAQLSGIAVQNEQVSRSQAGARAAMDAIKSALRSAGAEVDLVDGQQTFVYAAPHTVAFNANILPGPDPMGTGTPGAIQAGQANSGVPSDASPFYSPNRTYDTGAETIVFSLDSNRDGVIDGADKSDDPEETSANPNDYVLYRTVHGFDGTANIVDVAPIAVLRGPERIDASDYNPPLFSYWLDHDDDTTTPPQMFGDANGNGRIDAAEAPALTPLGPRDLARIEQIQISVSSETATADPDRVHEHGGYERVTLEASVQVRQRPRSTSTVYGFVYKDLNGNGSREMNEPTISGVLIRSSTGMTTRTGGDGRYLLTVNPGSLTITEVDPVGYSSTTQNDAAVDAYSGSYHQVDFGDAPSSGMAVVHGMVFADDNDNAAIDNGERGIANVRIYSDTGEFTETDAEGNYRLDVPVGNRAISEVDSTGYVSTTPNSVNVNMTAEGQVEVVNFGDRMVDETGTIEGYVFNDEDRDGTRDNREDGIPGAFIIVDGGSAESDVAGFFSLTVPVGRYDVTEQDPPGYSSTTPNTLRHIDVEADQTTTVSFGDIVQEDIEFDVIELANTERALSIIATDLQEDNRGDLDLVLGTRYSGGSNNLLVWHNQRRNSRTPNSAIYENTPTFTRPNVADVTTLRTEQIGGDSAGDILAGLANPAGYDMAVWIAGGGDLPTTPDYELLAQNGDVVWDVEIVDFTRDGVDDLVVAVETGSYQGHVEFWKGRGNGEFTLIPDATLTVSAGGLGEMLGTVRAVEVEDINDDGFRDLVVASLESDGHSSVNVYLQPALAFGVDFVPMQQFAVNGEISGLELTDMVEDDSEDLDIIVAVKTSETLGGVELWHQKVDGRYGILTEAGRIQDDWMDAGGAPLSLAISHLDNDVFPDVIVGVRSGYTFDGTIEIARSFGHLPSETQPTTEWSIGAVITMTEGDFNMDGIPDLAAGTQTSSTSGKVFIFFRR